MRQIHKRVVFEPIDINELTANERKNAMECITFLIEKKNNDIKTRTLADGRAQRGYVDRDEAASPTASTDAIMITGVIDAKQNRDVMTLDIPNAFTQTEIDEKKNNIKERIMMRIRGEVAKMLVELDPETKNI